MYTIPALLHVPLMLRAATQPAPLHQHLPDVLEDLQACSCLLH